VLRWPKIQNSHSLLSWKGPTKAWRRTNVVKMCSSVAHQSRLLSWKGPTWAKTSPPIKSYKMSSKMAWMNVDARNSITNLHRINGGKNCRPTKVMSLLGSAVWLYRNISTPRFINCPGILWDSTMKGNIHVQSPCLICFCLCPIEAQKFSFVAKICARQCYEAGSLYMYFLLRDSISQYSRAINKTRGWDIPI
jgi:hypothetical protein